MPRAPHACTRSNAVPTGTAAAVRIAGLLMTIACTVWAHSALAQDWGESDDDWNTAPATEPSGGTSAWNEPAGSHWAFRAGLGFTIDPDNFLMNFELPYRFDQYVSAGPMIQIGVADEKLLVAPTATINIRVPDMPGDSFDRFHPNLFAGLGFAVIQNDDRRGDNTDAGFLVNTGFGLDYDLSARVSLGSRMIFNFLPASRTLGERFWYSWEVVGIQLSF